MVIADELVKTYRRGEVHALRGVSFRARAEELLAIKGRSGSGKTTVLNIVGGLDTADSGSVCVDGQDVGALDEEGLLQMRRKTIGFVFQSFGLVPVLSAAENVGVPLRLTRANRHVRDEEVARMLALVGLEDHAEQRPHELSGGQQQRVAIARALVNRPKLLIADEPTGQLDSETAQQIMQLIADVVRDQGMTAVVSTHDPLMLRHSDRVVELRDGTVSTGA